MTKENNIKDLTEKEEKEIFNRFITFTSKAREVAKEKGLQADKEVILSSMLRSMQRDRLYSRKIIDSEVV